MKLKCAILDDYQQVALKMADWSALADRVEVSAISAHFTDETELAVHLQECDILVIMRERTPMTASLLARLPKLKLLITSGMRNASIDLAAAAERGVVVCGTSSGSAAPMELTRRCCSGWRSISCRKASGCKTTARGSGISALPCREKRWGCWGWARSAARWPGWRRRSACGCWLEPEPDGGTGGAGGALLAPSKRALFEQSDFVSIHLVLSDRSRGLVGRDELTAMKPTAYLINTSRAAIVDRAALVDVLQQRKIAGAGLDVFETEPLPADDAFRQLPNVLATPHVGYVADDNYRAYFTEAVEDIAAFLAGQPIRRLG